MVGVDLLQKLILRVRPYAVDAAEAQRAFDKSLERWVQGVEKKADLVKLMRSIAEEFGKVRLDHNVRKPRIGIVGEIYVRNHEFANRNIVAQLEALGAACDVASLAEWIYYTNFTRHDTAMRRRQIGTIFNNAIQNYFQRKIEKSLARPLEERFGRLAEVPVEHVIKLAEPYMNVAFEGEAVLSIGKTIEYHEEGFGGVINVMPFTCMPSTIVSTQTRRLSSDCDEMPILNLSFDGQEDATMTTRLEAFVEQVASRQKAGVGEMVHG